MCVALWRINIETLYVKNIIKCVIGLRISCDVYPKLKYLFIYQNNTQFILKLITINYLLIYLQVNVYVHLGFERIDGTWRWFDGRTYPSEVGYGVWQSGQPNGDEDCALIHYGASPADSLYDVLCIYPYRRVCMIQ